MRRINVVIGPAMALFGLLLLASTAALGGWSCLVGAGSLASRSACGTGGELLATVGSLLGIAFLLGGYAAFTRGVTGY